MANQLLIEIGTEELPASFVTKALGAMPSLAADLLARARLSHAAIVPLGTPRRLALMIEDVADRQEDLSEQVQGPPKRVALDAEGKLTKAGQGFARKQGLSPEDLFVVETDKGEYLAFKREEKGRPALEVLPDVLADLMARVPFPKSMRWGAGEVAFGRPIHWVVALHGEEVVATEFAGVRAGRATRGHRFLAPAGFELPSPEPYQELLRRAHVVVDPGERRDAMHAALRDAAQSMGGELVEDPFLLEECTSLVEEPHVVPGAFEPSYLDLPDGVVVSVMRDHQRYFAVRDPHTGRLLPRYLNVVNTANAPETIARGNDRVLRARLADARFFVDEDRKRPLETRTRELDGVVFQTKLGSLGDKVRRIRTLTQSFFEPGDEARLADRAATLCKNDLVTLIVGEFPELQGEMGRFYAAEQGEDAGVAEAIRDHYLPRGSGDAVPTGRVSAAVAVADRADTLAGCFGIGLVPSGSADPFALRRATLGIVRIALLGPLDVSVRDVIGGAWDGYPSGVLRDRDQVVTQLDEFFRARLKAYYGERFPGDLLEACLGAWDGRSLRDLDKRVQAVAAFRELPEYASLAVAFKRAFNIAKDGPEGDVDASLLTEEAERSLADRFANLKPVVDGELSAGRYEEALSRLANELKHPIDRFFEEVFVMVDDEAVRTNRLKLLRSISDTLSGIAHFHQLAT